jgi:Family of unknown function (DUF6049)
MPRSHLRRIGFTAAAGAALFVSLAGAFTGSLAGPASAGTGVSSSGSRAATVQAQSGRGLRVTIGSVSPDIGRPGKAVTVTGRVANGTHATARGLTAVLRSSGGGLQYRGQLDNYADGDYSGDQPVSAPVSLPDLAPGRSASFRLSFLPGNAGIQQFGVYPLAAQVDQANGSAATARTFLPFWPGSQPSLRKLKVAWIWPLIDQPRQGACPALLGNSLESSLDGASGGRLGGLLEAGRSAGRDARITWAVDPALLTDVDAMTSPYHVLDGPRCRDLRDEPASTAARKWLASLSATLSKGQGDQPVFTTPYADVDIAALTHSAGFDTDLASAFTMGRATATTVLGQKLEVAGGGTLDGTAWPAGGLADSSVLDNLAVNRVQTAVLDSNEMPPLNPVDYTPDAVTRVPTGVGSDVRVLLSDDALTKALGGSGAAAGSTPAQTEQWFLAETAMIAAEAPGLSRSVVVAPPQRWSPSGALAAGLLSDTASAPWLQPTYLDKLTAAAPASVTRTSLPPSQVSPAELSRGYLAGIKPIDASIQRFNSLLSRPDTLQGAVARAESSAWRGNGQAAGQDLTGQVGRYVADQENKIHIISSRGVTLSGARGNVPVSITNQLPRGYTATVRLKAAAAATPTVPAARRLTIGHNGGAYVQTVTIRPGESTTIRLPVHAYSPGLTQVDLWLLTPNGTPLSAQPTVLKVQSAHLGLAAEVITGAAVGVLVITTIIRVIRRGLREGRPAPPGRPKDGPQDGPAGEPEAAGDPRPGPAGETAEGAAQTGYPPAAAADTSPAGTPPGGDPSPGTPGEDSADGAYNADGTHGTHGADGTHGTHGTSRGAFPPRDVSDQYGFFTGHGGGQEAGTVMTEDGRPPSQHPPQYPEEPDEFADARPRAWPDTP